MDVSGRTTQEDKVEQLPKDLKCRIMRGLTSFGNFSCIHAEIHSATAPARMTVSS